MFKIHIDSYEGSADRSKLAEANIAGIDHVTYDSYDGGYITEMVVYSYHEDTIKLVATLFDYADADIEEIPNTQIIDHDE
jgi:hypothetical protein